MNQELKNDARSLKTRRSIKNALMQLLRTKELGEITIKELTELSGRNRNSFYTHYRSCYDVLIDINNDIIGYVEGILSKYTFEGFFKNPKPLLDEMSNLIISHQKRAGMLIFVCLSADMRNRTTSNLTELILDRFIKEGGKEAPTTRYIISFFVTGVLDMYANWFLHGGVGLDELSQALALFLKNGSYILRRYVFSVEDKG